LVSDNAVLSGITHKDVKLPGDIVHYICFYPINAESRAHSYLMKKSTEVLLYFGLNCGMLEFFTKEP
jgi:hypothetical protein